MKRKVRLDHPPQRIVSLVPSQTELLHALGLGDRVVGITKFCVHPNDWYRNKIRVGGTKSVNFDKIKELRPDLIIGNKEENEQGDIERLEELYPVWMSDIYDLPDALEMIGKVGELTATTDTAQKLKAEVESAFFELEEWVSKKVLTAPSAAYFIWKNPDFCAGTNTFIDAMLRRCGLKNFVQDDRYPEFAPSDSHPDLIFLSSEPYPFKSKHAAEFQARFPKTKIMLVDGEMFSWYGSRLTKAPEYFRRLLEELASDEKLQ